MLRHAARDPPCFHTRTMLFFFLLLYWPKQDIRVLKLLTQGHIHYICVCYYCRVVKLKAILVPVTTHVYIVNLMLSGIVPAYAGTIAMCGYTAAVQTPVQTNTINYQILAPPGAATGVISPTEQVRTFISMNLRYLTHLKSCLVYRQAQTYPLNLFCRSQSR